MLICKDNIVYMFGSTKEGFIGNYSDDPKITLSSDVRKMDAVKEYITTSIKDNNSMFTDAFTNAKKLLNSKINKLVKDNYTKKFVIEEMEKQRDILNKKLEDRIKIYINTLDAYSLKFPCKEISVLIEILKYLQEKEKRVV